MTEFSSNNEFVNMLSLWPCHQGHGVMVSVMSVYLLSAHLIGRCVCRQSVDIITQVDNPQQRKACADLGVVCSEEDENSLDYENSIPYYVSETTRQDFGVKRISGEKINLIKGMLTDFLDALVKYPSCYVGACDRYVGVMAKICCDHLQTINRKPGMLTKVSLEFKRIYKWGWNMARFLAGRGKSEETVESKPEIIMPTISFENFVGELKKHEEYIMALYIKGFQELVELVEKFNVIIRTLHKEFNLLNHKLVEKKYSKRLEKYQTTGVMRDVVRSRYLDVTNLFESKTGPIVEGEEEDKNAHDHKRKILPLPKNEASDTELAELLVLFHQKPKEGGGGGAGAFLSKAESVLFETAQNIISNRSLGLTCEEQEMGIQKRFKELLKDLYKQNTDIVLSKIFKVCLKSLLLSEVDESKKRSWRESAINEAVKKHSRWKRGYMSAQMEDFVSACLMFDKYFTRVEALKQEVYWNAVKEDENSFLEGLENNERISESDFFHRYLRPQYLTIRANSVENQTEEYCISLRLNFTSDIKEEDTETFHTPKEHILKFAGKSGNGCVPVSISIVKHTLYHGSHEDEAWRADFVAMGESNKHPTLQYHLNRGVKELTDVLRKITDSSTHEQRSGLSALLADLSDFKSASATIVGNIDLFYALMLMWNKAVLSRTKPIGELSKPFPGSDDTLGFTLATLKKAIGFGSVDVCEDGAVLKNVRSTSIRLFTNDVVCVDNPYSHAAPAMMIACEILLGCHPPVIPSGRIKSKNPSLEKRLMLDMFSKPSVVLRFADGGNPLLADRMRLCLKREGFDVTLTRASSECIWRKRSALGGSHTPTSTTPRTQVDVLLSTDPSFPHFGPGVCEKFSDSGHWKNRMPLARRNKAPYTGGGQYKQGAQNRRANHSKNGANALGYEGVLCSGGLNMLCGFAIGCLFISALKYYI